jgi:hypothetical protein
MGLCLRGVRNTSAGCGKNPPLLATRKCLKLRASRSRILVRLIHKFLPLVAHVAIFTHANNHFAWNGPATVREFQELLKSDNSRRENP